MSWGIIHLWSDDTYSLYRRKEERMKYTIEFTEVVAYLSQDIEADSEQEAIEKVFRRMQDGMIPVVNTSMDYCISTERKEDPADRDDRLYHEGVDDEAGDRAIHNHPLGTGFAQKDKKGDK